MKFKSKISSFFFLLLFGLCIFPHKVEAASANVEFSTKTPFVKAGGILTVVCRVVGDEAFLDVDFYISYDSKILQFVSGGDKVSGEKGLLHVSSTGNTEAVLKKSFSLQFEAKKNGHVAIEAADTAKVVNAENTVFSVSSNQLSIEVGTTSVEGKEPEKTSKPENLSRNTKLSEFECSGIGGLVPEFAPQITRYSTTVDYKTDTLFFSYQTANKKATAVMSGNKELHEGKNEAIVTVTAESGKVRQYRIQITKESKAETKKRELQEKSGADGSSFEVMDKNGQVVLKNAYEFYVQDISELTEIPAGYIATKVQLDGISIPAFTMENDLDNNYLLLYLKGASKTPEFYQFDREERTLQRYTGDLIAKVNKSGQAGYQTVDRSTGNKDSKTVLYGVIIGCMIAILLLLTVLLKLLGQNYKYKQRQKRDELDF